MPTCGDPIDVYLQLLYEAQRVEDQRLARLVRERIKQHIRQMATGDQNGLVISLPFGSTCAPGPLPEVSALSPSWPARPTLQVLSIIGLYGYTIVLYLLLRL